MDIYQLTEALGWCTLINAGILAMAFATIAFAGDWIHRVHSRWYPIPRETFYAVNYAVIGVLKVLWFFLNLVPWIALQIAA